MHKALAPPPPARRHDEVAGLLAWHPLHWLAALLVLVLAVPAARVWSDWGHFVPGGLAIETEGASGRIGQGQFSLDLPLSVFNGTSQTIFRVTLWVEAYACPEENAALTDCRQITAFEQQVAMHTAPGSSGRFSQHYAGGLPASIPGPHLRVERRVASVTDENDRERDKERAGWSL